MKTLPQFVKDILASPPPRGQGLNLWLFRAARVLWPYRTEPEILQTLAAAVAGEPVRQEEIARAVARSKSCAWTPGAQPPPRADASWPAVDEDLRESVVRAGRGVAELYSVSPTKFEYGSHSEEVVDVLFPGNPWLCIGKSSSEFATRRRETWRGRLHELALIVPSPMTSRRGMTQEGRPSEHALENTGPRRFLVIEQDRGSHDEQSAVIFHLAERAPLAAVVFSGSRSLHAWFYCAGQGDASLKKFMRYAVSLGADRATWTRSQFVRLPGGRRDNGNHQEIVYLNMEVIK